MRKGVQVQVLHFPDRTTETGKRLNAYLNGEVQMTERAAAQLFSQNRREKEAFIQEKLKEGVTLLVDRYIHSGVAYAHANGVPLDTAKQLDVGLPVPDCVIYLDITPANASKRPGWGTERFESLETQRRVQDVYCILYNPHTWTIFTRPSHRCIKRAMRVVRSMTPDTPIRLYSADE